MKLAHTAIERASINANRVLVETAEERRSLERQVVEIAATRDNLLTDFRSLSAQMLHAAEQYDAPLAHTRTDTVVNAHVDTDTPTDTRDRNYQEPAPHPGRSATPILS
jgi:hypothetical protein